MLFLGNVVPRQPHYYSTQTAVWGVLASGKAPETLRAEELHSIVRRACITAGLSTQKHGGISSISTIEAVDSVLNK